MVHGVVCLPFRVVHNESSQEVHIASFGLNMLDDGTSGSNKIRIQSKNAVWLAQCETAARQHGWHGDTGLFWRIDAIEKYHKVRVFIVGLAGFKWTYQTPYSGRASFGDTIIIKAARQDVIVLHFPVELYMLCPGTREDGISIDALHRVDPQESTGTRRFFGCALLLLLYILMAYLVPKSAGDDCVIQQRAALVFWCFGVYKITAMNC
ncbi:hypothetical protein O0I10_002478 [Lichtheimia ornata]|uniref:Uncharacterized protein n=1 Tax=Lichtheimia ornata TaxID=688661 RepID=A0AAD7Y1P4_9FUNG|nr:uncharacterized protein O0I10_002478 [Lichtheimia ornata]KAJ8661671.1 hypothetical protein O0I10_002478 [Lichtheimia ornata]